MDPTFSQNGFNSVRRVDSLEEKPMGYNDIPIPGTPWLLNASKIEEAIAKGKEYIDVYEDEGEGANNSYMDADHSENGILISEMDGDKKKYKSNQKFANYIKQIELRLHKKSKNGTETTEIIKKGTEIEVMSEEEYERVFSAVLASFQQIARDSKKVEEQKSSSSSTLTSKTVTYIDSNDSKAKDDGSKVNGKKAHQEQQRVKFHESIHKAERQEDDKIADAAANRRLKERNNDRRIRAKLIYIGKQEIWKYDREHENTKES